MSYRVNSLQVRTVNTDLDPLADLSLFIGAANCLINNVCVPLTYDDTTLLNVELFLSAHFATLDDRKATFAGAGDTQDQYQHAEDIGFNATEYGQMALRLDFKGGLASLEAKVKKARGGKPGILYIGGYPCGTALTTSQNPWIGCWWWGWGSLFW